MTGKISSHVVISPYFRVGWVSVRTLLCFLYVVVTPEPTVWGALVYFGVAAAVLMKTWRVFAKYNPALGRSATTNNLLGEFIFDAFFTRKVTVQ